MKALKKGEAVEVFCEDLKRWEAGVIEMVWRCIGLDDGKRFAEYEVAGGDFEKGEGWRGRFDDNHIRKPGENKHVSVHRLNNKTPKRLPRPLRANKLKR